MTRLDSSAANGGRKGSGAEVVGGEQCERLGEIAAFMLAHGAERRDDFATVEVQERL